MAKGILLTNCRYVVAIFSLLLLCSCQADKPIKFPGQPSGYNFSQYAGYVKIDPKTGKSFYYIFVEAEFSPATKPLVLWLNGGEFHSKRV